MPDYTEIEEQALIVNQMSKEKYESITPEPYELYLTPDTTEQDIADAISTHNTSNTAHTDIRNAIPTKISDLTDDTSTNPIDKADTLTGLTATITELNYVDGVTSDIQTQLNGKLTTSDIIDNVLSTATDKALSANQGKVLQDEITHLQGIGRFLSLWDATTGLAETNPPVSPYTYKTGDYFIVGVVGATNYKPSGSSYTTGVASTTVETETIEVGNVYYYDGTTWKLQAGGGGGTITDVLVNGSSVVNAGVASVTVPVEDVQQNGTSLVTSGVANIPNAVIFRDWD